MTANISYPKELPMLNGYTIGGIIKKNDLELFHWEKFRSDQFQKLAEIQMKIEERKKSASYSLSPKDEMLLLCDLYEIQQITKTALNMANENIIRLYKAGISSFSLEETLPIDRSCSVRRIEKDSDAVEKTSVFTFCRSEGVRAEMDEFVTQLFPENIPVSCLIPGTLDKLVSGITSMLRTSGKVELIGSVINLERVKVMDPVVFRKNAIISDNLIKNCSNYYVLTESVLVGVFFGYAKSISGSGISSDSQLKESTASFSMINYFSQGALPKIDCRLDHFNPWQVFNSWREALLSNPEAGYPFCFRYRNLKDILIENNIIQAEVDMSNRREAFSIASGISDISDLLASQKKSGMSGPFQANSNSSSSITPDLIPFYEDRVGNFSEPEIAKYLWLDSADGPISNFVQKVNVVAVYLWKRGFQLRGVKADGHGFYGAFLKSYTTLSKNTRS